MKGIIVSSRNCQHCHELEERLKQEIESGEIKVLEVEDGGEELDRLVKAFDIRGVPTVLNVKVEQDKKKLCPIMDTEGNTGPCLEVEGVDY